MRKSRLGRGLEALLGEGAGGEVKYRTVPVESLSPRQGQPRIDKETDLDELVESVKKHGVLQPIIATEKEGKLLIIAGERRWLAAQKAGLKEVPVIIGNWDDKDIAILSIVENVQRKDLSPLEEALYYKRLQKEFGLTQNDIASLTGKSRAHIANILRVLKLPDAVTSALQEGKITLGHAKALLSLRNEKEIVDLFHKILEEELSVRETEELVSAVKRKKRKEVEFKEISKYRLKAKVTFGKKSARLVITGRPEDIKRFLSEIES